jgi:hypothetical protein
MRRAATGVAEAVEEAEGVDPARADIEEKRRK